MPQAALHHHEKKHQALSSIAQSQGYSAPITPLDLQCYGKIQCYGHHSEKYNAMDTTRATAGSSKEKKLRVKGKK